MSYLSDAVLVLNREGVKELNSLFETYAHKDKFTNRIFLYDTPFEVWLDKTVMLRFMEGKEESPSNVRRRKAVVNIARKIRDLPVKWGGECI